VVHRQDNTLDGLIFVKKEYKRELFNMQMKDKGLDELKMIVVDDDDEEKVSNHWNEDFSS
jgi:hypothetical protein